MYKINWKKETVMIIIIVVLILSAFVLYNYLPQRIPMHWNIKGEVDRYGDKSIGNILIFPLTNLGLYLLMLFIPYIDKKKDKYGKFFNVYYILRLSMMIFMCLMYVSIMLVSFGYNVPIGKVIPVIVGIFFIITGNYMGKVRQNSFVGIKLPWTLKNELVWNKTNRFAGYLFVITGLINIISVVLRPLYSYILLIMLLFLILIITTIYSYLLYKKVTKGE